MQIQDSTIAVTVGATIDTLVSKVRAIGGPGSFVWDAMRRQTFIRFGLSTLVLAVFVSMAFLFFRKGKLEDAQRNDPDFWYFITVLMGFVSLVAFLTWVGFASEAMNPDYTVIKELLDVVKPDKD